MLAVSLENFFPQGEGLRLMACLWPAGTALHFEVAVGGGIPVRVPHSVGGRESRGIEGDVAHEKRRLPGLHLLAEDAQLLREYLINSGVEHDETQPLDIDAVDEWIVVAEERFVATLCPVRPQV